MSSLADLHRFRREYPAQTLRVGGLRWGAIDSARGRPAHGRPVLLLLPGTLGSGEIFWQQVRALHDRVRLIALTYPAVADVARYADGAVGVLRRLGVARASVLGTSLGGYTAQVLALRHPGVVERLFIANSLCDARRSWAARHAPARDIAAMPAPALKAERTARIADWPESDAGLALSKAVIGLQGREVLSARHLKARVLALLHADALPPLPVPDARIVVIECDDDPVMPPEVRREVRQRYPGAAVHALPSGGHFPYIARPDAYSAILRQHLPGG